MCVTTIKGIVSRDEYGIFFEGQVSYLNSTFLYKPDGLKFSGCFFWRKLIYCFRFLLQKPLLIMKVLPETLTGILFLLNCSESRLWQVLHSAEDFVCIQWERHTREMYSDSVEVYEEGFGRIFSTGKCFSKSRKRLCISSFLQKNL